MRTSRKTRRRRLSPAPHFAAKLQTADQASARSSAPSGRAISARNATTHGLFARDIVLPALGEDPAAFDSLLKHFCEQLPPQNLLERHYIEQIAAASWRLRRLHRWQAQVYEDEALSEDQRLDKLDKVLRHEIALSRQIDRAIRTLNRDLKSLFAQRAYQDSLCEHATTDAGMQLDPDLIPFVQRTMQKKRRAASDADLGAGRLDNTTSAESEKCENEPLATSEMKNWYYEPWPGEPREPIPPTRSPQPMTNGEAYIAYRKREQAIFNQTHPNNPDPTEWDDKDMQMVYGGHKQKLPKRNPPYR